MSKKLTICFVFVILFFGSGCTPSVMSDSGSANRTPTPARAAAEEVAPRAARQTGVKNNDCGGGYWVSAGLSRSGELVVYDTSDGRIPQKVIAGGVVRTMQECGFGQSPICRKVEQAGMGLSEPFILLIDNERRKFEGFRSHVRQRLCGK